MTKNQNYSPEDDRLPPHSVESEQGVLSCVLQEPALFDEVNKELRRTEAFYDHRHQAIWEALAGMSEDHVGIDTVLLGERLKLMNRLDAIGGALYLAELADFVPSPANLKGYLQVVQDRYLLRRMIRVASEAIQSGMNPEPGATAKKIVSTFDKRLFDECLVEANTTRLVHVKEGLTEVITDIENTKRGVGMITGYPTGLGYLDKKMGGLRPGELIAIAARPGRGKTSLGGTLILNTAIRGGVKCGFFTMEMSYKAIILRLLCAESRVDSSKLRDGFPGERTIMALTNGAAKLSKSDIWFDDGAGQDIETLRSTARQMVKRHGVQMIVVDYWQLMKSETKSGQGRANELGHVSNGLKALAMELQVPVVLLAQLNREFEKGQRRGSAGEDHPRMSDIKDCGSLDQDADVILMIYAKNSRVRAEMEAHGVDPDKGNPMELPFAPVNLWLEKQRNGPTHIDIELKYWREYTLFEDAFNNHGKVGGGEDERGRGAPSRRTGQGQVEDEPKITAEDVKQTSVFFEENDEKRIRKNHGG